MDIHDTINISDPKIIMKILKMSFIFNAIQDGWEVKRKQNVYVFQKKHEGKKEVMSDTYLKCFIEKNMIF